MRINVWRWNELANHDDFNLLAAKHLGGIPKEAGHLQGHAVLSCRGTLFCADTGDRVDQEHLRPCAHCGLPQSPKEHDGCIESLPDVKFACCGHGVEQARLTHGERFVEENGTPGMHYYPFSPVPIAHPARGGKPRKPRISIF